MTVATIMNCINWFSQISFKNVCVFIISLQDYSFPREKNFNKLYSHVAHLVNSDDRSEPKVTAKSTSESHCSANQTPDQDRDTGRGIYVEALSA